MKTLSYLLISLICYLISIDAYKPVPEGKKRKPSFLENQGAYESVVQKQNNRDPPTTRTNTEVIQTIEPTGAEKVMESTDIEYSIIKKIPSEKCPRKSQVGDYLQVYYRLYLASGPEIDSSFKKGKPNEFVLGSGTVPAAWEKGLKDMCIGEIREIRTSADLSGVVKGSGSNDAKDTDLIYKMELAQILNYQWPEHLIKRDEL